MDAVVRVLHPPALDGQPQGRSEPLADRVGDPPATKHVECASPELLSGRTPRLLSDDAHRVGDLDERHLFQQSGLPRSRLTHLGPGHCIEVRGPVEPLPAALLALRWDDSLDRLLEFIRHTMADAPGTRSLHRGAWASRTPPRRAAGTQVGRLA